jgi:recombination protein RecA
VVGKAAKSVEELVADIDRAYGPGTLMRLGDNPLEAPDVFSSGSIGLDEVLGVGGIPRGRIIEIYGPESSGKTSIALHATGNAQRKGLRAAFIDAEHALDPEWAAVLGVNTEDLFVSQPDSGDQALKVTARLVSSGLFGVVTVDSVAALVPEAELKGEIGDTHVGLQARMMSQGLRMLTGPAADTGTTVIFINQLREKVGVFFGNSETQPGGKALKFYSTIRLDVRRIATLKSGDRATGSRVRVRVVKNKLSPPFGVAEFDFNFGVGISHEAELVDLAVERRIVKKSGAWYTYEGTQLGQGKENACAWLAQHPEEAGKVEAAVRAAPPAVKAARKGRGDEGGIAMEGPAPWEEDGAAELSRV